MNLPVLAVILPCFNEEEVLNTTCDKLQAVVCDLISKQKISRDSILLFVDDGSSDKTWTIINELTSKYENIKGIKLSANKGHQIALFAGMEFVANKDIDCILSIDADLQQDEKSIENFVDKFSMGFEVIYGVRNDRKTDGFLKKITATGFYRLMNLMGVSIVYNHADYRLLSKRANQSLISFKEVNLFLRGSVPLIGYKTDTVYFDVKDRFEGESKYTINKMLSFAIDGITSFSVHPLRMISFLGFIVFFFSFLMSIFVASALFFTDSVVPGWASTVLPIYFLGGVQLLSIGIVGEYVGKIYKETKQRPKYFIEEEV